MNPHRPLRSSVRVWLSVIILLFIATWFIPDGKYGDEPVGDIWRYLSQTTTFALRVKYSQRLALSFSFLRLRLRLRVGFCSSLFVLLWIIFIEARGRMKPSNGPVAQFHV